MYSYDACVFVCVFWFVGREHMRARLLTPAGKAKRIIVRSHHDNQSAHAQAHIDDRATQHKSGEGGRTMTYVDERVVSVGVLVRQTPKLT